MRSRLARLTSRPVLLWALAPPMLMAVALACDLLRPFASFLLVPEVVLLWPGWCVWLLAHSDTITDSVGWLAALNLPWYYASLSPLLSVNFRRSSLRSGSFALICLIACAQIVLGLFFSWIAYDVVSSPASMRDGFATMLR
ncbi:MAG: hypothetical protein IPP07_30115 [Holophagales bacterium]|nr:hypothetical protein [Holophagales bacterium]MBK9968869.1 hypothetical protein [Holophagales bacterium]